MGSIKKEIFIGFLVGLAATAGGFYLYVEYVLEGTFAESLTILKENSLYGQVLSIAAIPNLIAFFIGSDSDRTTEVSAPRVHILTFDANHSCISVFPVVTSIGHKQYLECKYKKISEITIPVEQVCIPENEQDVIDGLELLPSGFVKDIRYGLGLKKELRFIIDAVEEFTDNSILVICTEEDTGDQDDCFFLNWYDYDEMRKVCNRLTNRARKAAKLTKTASMYNHLAFRLGREQKLLPTSHDAISKMLRIKISDHDKQAALDLVTQDKAVLEHKDKKHIDDMTPEERYELFFKNRKVNLCKARVFYSYQ